MNDLLEAVITAHGGSDRWNAVRSVDVTFNMKAWMRALRRRSGCVSTHKEDLDMA